MTAETDALTAWRQHLEEAIGVAEAASVLRPFETVDWSRLATKDDLQRFATKDDLERFVTREEFHRELGSMRDVLRAEITAAEHRTGERVNDTLRKQTWAIVVGVPALMTALLGLLQVLS